jgi:hypothetical protein
MPDIRDTLRSSLFLHPPPLIADVYLDNINRIFPGKNDFIQFLEEKDNQKRIDLSAALIVRLLKESCLYMPSKFLYSIVEIEERLTPKLNNIQYFPQDHFVHIVNMYMLGVYLYMYHKKFHRTLNTHLESVRQANDIKGIITKEVLLFDFIYCWRTFSLLHDIGYIYEFEYDNKDDKYNHISKDLFKIRSRMKHLNQYILEELSISWLSRMSSWTLIDESFPKINLTTLDPEYSIIYESLSRSHLPLMQKPFDKDIYKHHYSIPQLNGKMFYSILANICSVSNLVILVSNSKARKLLFSILPDLNDKNKYNLHMHDNTFKSSTIDPEHFVYSLINGKLPQTIDTNIYDIHVYCPNYISSMISYFDDISTHIKGRFNKVRVDNACHKIINDTSVQVSTITSDTDYHNFEHIVYNQLIKWWWTSNLSNTTRSKENISCDIESLIYNNVLDKNKYEIINVVINMIRESYNELDISNISSSSKHNFDKYIDIILSRILNIEKIKDQTLEKCLDDIQSGINDETDRYYVLNEVNDKYLKNTLEPMVKKNSRLLLREMVDSLLHKSQMPAIKELLKYKPDYLKSNSIDHGIASYYMCEAMYGYYCAMSDIMKYNGSDKDLNILKKTISIINGIGSKDSIVNYEYRNTKLFAEACRAIIMHNIYPKYLDKKYKNKRVSIKKEPFCYFSMIVDAIQRWDRDIRIWHDYKKFPYKTKSDDYNIFINEGYIVISEYDKEIDIINIVKKMTEGLNEYMEGASHFILLNTGQYNKQ